MLKEMSKAWYIYSATIFNAKAPGNRITKNWRLEHTEIESIEFIDSLIDKEHPLIPGELLCLTKESCEGPPLPRDLKPLLRESIRLAGPGKEF